MTHRTLKLVLDDRTFARLEADGESADLLTHLTVEGRLVVLMPRVFQHQLSVRPGGMPRWLPIHDIADTTSAADVLVSDDPSCRSHAQSSARFEVLTYEEFVEFLKLLPLTAEILS